MGFYVDLRRARDGFYTEQAIPGVLWFLYAFAGLALLMMGLSAHSLLYQMAQSPEVWDQAIVVALALMVLFYFVVGLKFSWVRRFVRLAPQRVEMGYLLGKKPWVLRSAAKEKVRSVELVNQRPASNVAPRQHDDNQYYIRGHWRVVVTLSNAKSFVLDRHTEKAMLEGLYEEVLGWLKTTLPQ